MSYQTCPKCDGSGKKWNFKPTGSVWLDVAATLPTLPTLHRIGDSWELYDPTKEVCPVCKGKMIINEETGLPPGDPLNSDNK